MSFMDRLHERKIARLSEACTNAMRDGSPAEARRAWDELKAAIQARSPEQIERMEHSRILASPRSKHSRGLA